MKVNPSLLIDFQKYVKTYWIFYNKTFTLVCKIHILFKWDFQIGKIYFKVFFH